MGSVVSKGKETTYTSPLGSYTIGPLPEVEESYRCIPVINDNISKYSELYATKNGDAMAYIECITMHIGMFGVMATQYSNGGIQFIPKNPTRRRMGLW
jgi:hypothetical protein